ncbi:MAG: hypothetical protein ACLFN4_01430 [Candidatus Acetothermia bacterium]
MELKPRLLGALLGFALGLLFVFFSWTVVLLVLGLTLVGYFCGLYLESGSEIKNKTRELLSLFLR